MAKKQKKEEAPIKEADYEKEEVANLPLSIPVNGYNVRIRPMLGLESDGYSAGGLYTQGNIMLDIHEDSQRVAMALVHETLHAIFDHSSLRCRYNNIDGIDVEEEIVTQLGFSLAHIIATNPEFVRFVQEAFKGKEITQFYYPDESTQTNKVLTKRSIVNKKTQSWKTY